MIEVVAVLLESLEGPHEIHIHITKIFPIISLVDAIWGFSFPRCTFLKANIQIFKLESRSLKQLNELPFIQTDPIFSIFFRVINIIQNLGAKSKDFLLCAWVCLQHGDSRFLLSLCIQIDFLQEKIEASDSPTLNRTPKSDHRVKFKSILVI